MSKDQYVGWDVHQASTSYAVLDGSGHLVEKGVLETDPERLVGWVCGLTGRVHLTFEEGPYAAWLYDMIEPLVAELVVANPRRHLGTGEGKSDQLDARDLADRLRGGFLVPVYHDRSRLQDLQHLIHGYQSLVQDSVRLQNRRSALARSRGLSVADVESGELLGSSSAMQRFEWLSDELAAVTVLRKTAEKAVKQAARRSEPCRLLQTMPGFGPIRSAIVVAKVRTPYRFRTKRQLWKYAGLAVVTHSSSDYVKGPRGLERRQWQQTRGLNRHYSRALKYVFKSAALDASRRGALRPGYEARIAAGQRPEMATLTMARKLAAICLALWKRGETFEVSKIVQNVATQVGPKAQ
jgi:transposase